MTNNNSNVPTIADIRAQVKGLTGSDPIFGPHGLHVEFADVVLSLQWSGFSYCDNRGLPNKRMGDLCDPCANFEAAAWPVGGDRLPLCGDVDDVRGWVAWDDLAALVHDVKVLAHKAGA